MNTEPEEDIVFVANVDDEGATNVNNGCVGVAALPNTSNPTVFAPTSNIVSAATVKPGIVRINCGGAAFTDILGNQWEADSYVTGGYPYESKDILVRGTFHDVLYHTVRTGPEIVFYLLKNLPVGPATVKLHFAEVYWKQQNLRLFDVDIEGVKVAKNYDIWAKAGGEGKPLFETYNTHVTNGTLSVLFSTVTNQVSVCGIEIIPGAHTSEQPKLVSTIISGHTNTLSTAIPAPPVFTGIRINCGGDAYIDTTGQLWEADSLNSYFVGGYAYCNHELAIKGTIDDLIYQTLRTGPDMVLYRFPNMPSIHIAIKLHFVEIYWDKSNARVFDISIEGVKVATHYDVWSKAGGKGKVIVETYNSFVRDGQLTITFTTIKDQMNVSAIEILPVMF